jgi:iron complex transport system ATP-binding protein
MLRFQNISYAYKKQQVLNKLSNVVAAGEVTIILGQNGAGKSTLLQLLAGLIPNQSGEITLNNSNITAISRAELANSRAYLAQQQPIDFPFYVLELVELGAYPFRHQVTKQQVQAEARKQLHNLGLQDYENRLINTLSGGELQRAHIARTFLHATLGQVNMLFLDEPIAALDPKYQHLVLAQAQELAKQKKLGVLIVLHDIIMAARYANIIWLMKNGAFIATGSVEHVLTCEQVSNAFECEAHTITLNNKSFALPA